MIKLTRIAQQALFFISYLILAFSSQLGLAAKPSLQPQLAISPPRLEMYPETDKSTQSISVLNMGETPMKVQVSVNNWDLDEENKYRALAPNEQSLDQWLIINPVHLTIPANSQQTVRLAIRPRAKPEEGEHRAMVFFKQLPDPNKQSQINFNVGVPIYAYYGEVKRTAEVHSISFNPKEQEFVFDITNTGNAYVRPKGSYLVMAASDIAEDKDVLQLFSQDDKKIEIKEALSGGILSSQPVLAGQKRLVKNKIKFESLINEPYVVALKVNIAGRLFEKVFTVTPEE